MATEQLIIEVNYKDHDAKQKVDALTKSFERLNAVTSGSGFTKLNNVASSLASLGQALSGISGAGASLREVARSANDLSTAFKSFDAKSVRGLDRVANALNSINIQNKSLDAVSKLANGLSRLTSAAKDPNLSQNLQTTARSIAAFAQSVVNNISDETLSRFERLGTAMAGLSSGSGKSFNMSGMSGSAGYASKLFKDLGNNIVGVVKLGWQLGKLPFKMILSPIQAIGRGIEGMTGKFKSFLTGIGRIALYRAIRSGIKLVTSAVRDGVNNLYVWASMVGNSFQPTMDSLASSFMYLKNSIGACVSPILDALAPAFEVLVNQAVDVINIVNQVIATLTGASTWRKAVRSAASYADNISGLGHEAQDSADAVKELKRTILGFDEINRLDDKTTTTSPKQNGKDPTGIYGNQGALSFVEQAVTQNALDIADMLKKAWEKGDFTEIGNMIGLKIGNALLSVPWETKIQPAVVKLATSFGTLLNGMFDYSGASGEGGKRMWDGIAYTIYNAINTAVLGYVTFFDTVHWEGIGQGVGAALRQVLQNLNWDWIADALAAFPNAVIDAVTGFCKEMTAQDFYEAGQNIGSTISKALIKINWVGLFGNAVTLATNVLNGINGALEGFDWIGVKEAILTGIKAIPKERWATLGIQIGRAIFNVAYFVANLVDMLFSAIKEGKWGELVRGIKEGISEGIQSKGGWTGVAKQLGSFIVENLGTIELGLAFLVGFNLIKALPAAFATTVLSKLGALTVPGAAGKGLTLAVWAKALSIGAGVVMSIDTIKTILGTDFNNGSIKEFLGNTLNVAWRGALAGGLFGFGVGGLTGGLYGLVIGAGVTLSISVIKSMADNLKSGNTSDFLAQLGGGIAGAIIGFTFAGPIGALLGFSIGAILTLKFKEIIQDFSEVPGSRGSQNVVGGGSFVSGLATVDENGNFVAVKDGTITSKQDRRYGASSGSGTNWNEVTVYAKLDRQSVNDAWKNLSTWWSDLAKSNKVAKFITEGLTNQGTSWWNALKQYWNAAISGKKTAKFQTEGVTDQGSTWWEQLAGFWNSIVGRNQASRFSIQGVVNAANEWWSQTQGFWNQATRNSSLTASVGIGNAYNAFASAYNSMQSYFNSHTLTAFVQVSQVGTTVGGSITGALTTSSGSKVSTTNGALNLGDDAINALKKKKKASGGVFKDGFWHDITAFAAGGFPSGQMFIAREAGPELVGTIGGNTAVMNNNQIVASVSAGVAQAVSSVMGGANGSPIEVTVKVDSETLYRAVRKGERKAYGRYGTTVAIG